MQNFLKELRRQRGWNQARLAAELGVSVQSVQGYEAGRRVPDHVLERIRKIAPEMQISLDNVRESEHYGSSPSTGGANQNQRWHRLLDEVLASGEQDAITAVQNNLLVFASYVRSRRERHRKPKQAG